MSNRVAVVSGANRGLGLGTAEALAKQGFTVVMLGRDDKKIQSAAGKLAQQKLNVIPYPLDVTDDSQIEGLAQMLASKFGVVDVLINNAGVMFEWEDKARAGTSIMQVDRDTARRTLEVNTLGPLFLAQALLSLLRKSKNGRIVNVSSHFGSLEAMSGRWPGYRLSKSALNAVTRILHAELQIEKSPIKVNSVCPGWVKTDMGGPAAPRSLEEGVKSILWAATLPADGPSGGFYCDGKPLAW